MRKEFRSGIVVVLMLLVALALGGCAMFQAAVMPPLESYDFSLESTYNKGDYSMALPECVPQPPSNAIIVEDLPHIWWPISAIHVYYMQPEMPTLSVYFTKDYGVIGIVWHTEVDGLEKDEGFLYIGGRPVLVDLEAFETFFNDIKTGKKD